MHSATELQKYPDSPDLDFIGGDSEAARAVRAIDWAATALGPPSGWSPTLRMVVPFLLANRFPMLLWWGPKYIQIYNDAYSPILGAKHPWGMGKPVRECWSEIWHVLQPLIDTPFNGGPSTWMEDIELEINRHGFIEESHFTVAYSPVPDERAPRGIGGVLATVHEITDKVIGERRVRILSELGAKVAEAKTDQDACARAAMILSQHPKDVPFALLYLLEDSTQLRLVSTTGVDASATIATLNVESLDDATVLPLQQALCTESLQEMRDLSCVVRDVPAGPWADPPTSAVVVPIKSNVTGRPAGAIVIGVSSRMQLDALYRSFLDLVGSQIATAVANARAYEEERRRAAALAEIDRAKTAFFSNVSHEFRTPLTLMLGPLEDALSSPATPPALNSQLQTAQRNALRLLKLVNSLLDFARIEAGRVQASYESVDLDTLTADLASTFRSAMERAGLNFEVHCAPLGEPVYVDREMWEKVVLNLLSNAFKFTLQGTVSVTLRRATSHAVLEVTDTGAGIPESELPRLFERFHRVEETEARTHEGSGIGLALVQELVRLHGGSIQAASVERQGATFRVQIPFGSKHLPQERIRTRSARSATAIASQSYVQEALRWLPDASVDAPSRHRDVPESISLDQDQRFAATFGSRIVLADDNADMREYVRDLLSPFYAVEAVSHGEHALIATQRERPDLILSDVMMPQLDGFGLLRAVREDPALEDIPVIFLSARAGEESRIEGLSSGADDYIVKPFTARELLARVGALLELTRTRRENEARFEGLFNNAPIGMFLVDCDFRICEVNPIARPSFGDITPLIGRDFEEVVRTLWYGEYANEIVARFRHTLKSGEPYFTPERIERRRDRGVEEYYEWHISRIPLPTGRFGVVCYFRDISQYIQAREDLIQHQRQLEAADRQKDEFLAMLAHELRNPLAPIRNAGEILARLESPSPHARPAVETIERQVTHLTRLVDDLLDVSRITQGRIELRRQPVAVEDIVSRALETIDPLIQQKRHRITMVSSRRLLLVNADPERLVQCVGNILTNAAKYTPGNGEIRIETRSEGRHALISVSDNGIGIADDFLPRIFDLFVQGERSLDRAQGGLGIGLAIVKRLIEMQDGEVSAESRVRQGSTFQIRLPLLDDAVLPSPPVSPEKPRALRILVVDDNEDAANTLSMILKLDGHETATAYCGAEALDLFHTFGPELILLDIGLPGIDGYEVAAQIRASTEGDAVRLVAITGYGQETDRQRAQTAGFTDHLVKPVEFAALQRIFVEASRE